TKTIRVEEAGAWTVESDVPWLTVSPEEGSGADAVEIVIEANESDTDRVGTVTVADVAYIVTQRAPRSGLRELWAMGDGSFGQLGDNETVFRATPTSPASDVSMASAGSTHSLFVKTDGTL